MSAADTKTLIAQAVERLREELPALRNLQLVVKLELRARGGDVPIWRVELPGPKVDRDPAADARIDVSVARPRFNELAAEGLLEDWVRAYDRGDVKVTGDRAVVALLGNVIQRRRARARVVERAERKNFARSLESRAILDFVQDRLQDAKANGKTSEETATAGEDTAQGNAQADRQARAEREPLPPSRRDRGRGASSARTAESRMPRSRRARC